MPTPCVIAFIVHEIGPVERITIIVILKDANSSAYAGHITAYGKP